MIDVSSHLQNAIAAQVASHTDAMLMGLISDGVGGTTTGNSIHAAAHVHRRVEKAKIRSRIVTYSDGYWAKISINETDHVTYKLFNSGWMAKALHKIGFRKVIESGWSSVKQRDTVEATLGATYLAIDEAIQEDMKKMKHSKFLKEMIKTDPDNLKAIAQLDMLDKGDGPGSENDQPQATLGTVSMAPPHNIQYSNNMQVSGSGTITKTVPSKPASITFSNPDILGSPAEEIVRVDPEGNVSHGNAIADAIKQAKGELHGTKQE